MKKQNLTKKQKMQLVQNTYNKYQHLFPETREEINTIFNRPLVIA